MQMISVGVCKKPHGIKGELKVQIDAVYWEDFLNADVIFLNIAGKEVPYFKESARVGNDILIKLEDVNSREAAAVLTGKEIFLRQSDVSDDNKDNAFAYEDLTGFQLLDKDLGAIGVIDKVADYPQQMIAVLQYQGRKVLIPLSEPLIVEIDEAQRTILMELPAGLLEL